MPVTYPLGKPATSQQSRHGWFGVIGTANGYRSVEGGILVLATVDDAGLWWPANAPPEICGLRVFAQAVEPPALVTIINGDCEINDTYLRYGDFDPAEVRQQLAELGIVIRESVLPPGSVASGLTPLT